MMKTIQKIFIICFTLLVLISISGCNNDKKTKQEGIDKAIQMIDELPESNQITIDDEVEIVKARVFYNNLDRKSRSKVTNIKKLEELEKKLVILRRNGAYQEHALDVSNQIDKLPTLDNVTIEDDEKVVLVRNAYDTLNPEAKIKVSNYAKLEELEIKIAKLKREAAYYAKATAVIDRINALPDVDEITLEYRDEVSAIREAYNVLNSDLKPFVTNLSRLASLEYRIEELEYEVTYQKEAENVFQLIDQLPEIEDVTLGDESKINSARRSYNYLLDGFKYLVTNYDKLVLLENKVAMLKEEAKNQQIVNAVIEQINQLPYTEELTLEDKEMVENARNSYNKLGDQLKEKVTNYQKLVAAEEKIRSLTPYEIHFYNINEDELEDVKKVEISSIVATVPVNYVSDGFWSKYASEVFIYKTSILGANDRYQYALKIGCDYDQTQGCYVVTQVIESSVSLTVDNHNCEFFIFVHAANVNSYEKMVDTQVGDLVFIDKPMIDYVTSNYGANLTIIKNGDPDFTEYFVGTSCGTTILPKPEREGYIFVGWYDNSEYTGEKIETVDKETIVYARWEIDSELVEPENMLTDVADTSTSYTKEKREADKYFVAYDSMEVIKAKYEYVNSIDGMGLMRSYPFNTEDSLLITLYEEIYG